MKKVTATDERLVKLSHQLLARWYPLMLAMIILGGVVKFLFISREVNIYYLELVSLLSVVYLLVHYVRNRAVFTEKSDECMVQLRQTYLSRAFMFCFWVYVLGNLYYLFLHDTAVQLVNLLVCFIPCSILTLLLVKKGLLLMSPDRKLVARSGKDRFRELKKRAVVFSVVMTCFMLWGMPYCLGVPFEWGWNAYCRMALGVVCGIGWYYGMKFSILQAEKRAEQALENKDDEGK